MNFTKAAKKFLKQQLKEAANVNKNVDLIPKPVPDITPSVSDNTENDKAILKIIEEDSQEIVDIQNKSEDISTNSSISIDTTLRYFYFKPPY
jgi:hypothetical protein